MRWMDTYMLSFVYSVLLSQHLTVVTVWFVDIY